METGQGAEDVVYSSSWSEREVVDEKKKKLLDHFQTSIVYCLSGNFTQKITSWGLMKDATELIEDSTKFSKFPPTNSYLKCILWISTVVPNLGSGHL